jgi:glycoprotein endo-alpha-1,2-mannosidase
LGEWGGRGMHTGLNFNSPPILTTQTPSTLLPNWRIDAATTPPPLQIHWNHSVLPHWTAAVRAQYPDATFIAPHDIHAPFYPARGPYSSRDAGVMAAQFAEMRAAGIGAVAVSWWGRPGVSDGDSQGVVTDAAVDLVFRVAGETGMRVALHMEPYAGRTAHAFREDLVYVAQRYGG